MIPPPTRSREPVLLAAALFAAVLRARCDSLRLEVVAPADSDRVVPSFLCFRGRTRETDVDSVVVDPVAGVGERTLLVRLTGLGPAVDLLRLVFASSSARDTMASGAWVSASSIPNTFARSLLAMVFLWRAEARPVGAETTASSINSR